MESEKGSDGKQKWGLMRLRKEEGGENEGKEERGGRFMKRKIFIGRKLPKEYDLHCQRSGGEQLCIIDLLLFLLPWLTERILFLHFPSACPPDIFSIN